MNVIGKYEIVCPLSQPGEPSLYLATQMGFGGFRKLVVVHELDPDQGEVQQAFMNEVKVVAGFQHPNLAQVYDLEADAGRLLLATEFVAGASLDEVGQAFRLSKLRIPLGFVLMAVRDAGLALHYAHTFTDPLGTSHPVTHGAIDAKAIQVTYDGITKVQGFGVPKRRAGKATVADDLAALAQVALGALPESGDVRPELKQVLASTAGQKNVLDWVRALEQVAAQVIWKADQSGPLVQRMFSERRDETRELLSQLQSPGQSTAVMPLAKIFAGGRAAEDPITLPPHAVDRTDPALLKGEIADAETIVGKLPPQAAASIAEMIDEVAGNLPEGTTDEVTDVRRRPGASGPRPISAARSESEKGSRSGFYLAILVTLLLGGAGLLALKWKLDPNWVRARSPQLASFLERKLAFIPGFPRPAAAPPSPLAAAEDGGEPDAGPPASQDGGR